MATSLRVTATYGEAAGMASSRSEERRSRCAGRPATRAVLHARLNLPWSVPNMAVWFCRRVALERFIPIE
jgi:hypothetical protein